MHSILKITNLLIVYIRNVMRWGGFCSELGLFPQPDHLLFLEMQFFCRNHDAVRCFSEVNIEKIFYRSCFDQLIMCSGTHSCTAKNKGVFAENVFFSLFFNVQQKL